jgi:hypothetical protein
MIEAGAPNTEEATLVHREGVPAPPGVVMVAPPEVPRNAESTQSESRDPVEPRPRRMVQVFY